MLQIGPIGQNTILSQYKNEPCEARTMKKKKQKIQEILNLRCLLNITK